jgi:CheY-like chemotaxis protein
MLSVGLGVDAMATMNKTILLMGSDPVVRSVIQEALENAGYLVVATGDLGTAVDRMKETKPDLLIIRSYIESISGYDAAMFLRTKCPGLPVLMIGGLIDDDRLRYRMAVGVVEVFPKPYTASALIEKVREVLDESR